MKYIYIDGRSIAAQRIRLNSIDVTRLVATEHIRNKHLLLKSRSVIIAIIVIANMITLSILTSITATSHLKGWIYKTFK